MVSVYIARQIQRAGDTISMALMYEPSWKLEFITTLGITFISLAILYSKLYLKMNGFYIIPYSGLLIGVFRIWLLFYLKPTLRMIAATTGLTWLSMLVRSAFHLEWFALAAAAGTFMIADVLTIATFNAWAKCQSQRATHVSKRFVESN